ncbi:MAG TPA: hypothetical protein VGP26_32450 [Actinophytocola sp.]|nr:hypothetical protein [Actinophytocola sp.]
MSGPVVRRALRVAAVRAGEPGGLRFTERQLYYAVCRVLRPWHLLPRRPGFTVAPPLSYRDFRAALDRHGPVPGLLAPEPPRAGVARHTAEPDLFDYGLPRLLVSEPAGIAHMLRANDLPMESACPVFDAAELPLDPRLGEMLVRGEGTIYLLHDASAHGMTFPARLPGLTDVPAGVRVVALGLRPRQAAPLHLTHGRGPARPAAHGPRDAEARWLARGRFTEVAAVAPAALLRTVHRLVREVRPVRPQWSIPREVGFLTWPAAG